MKLIPQFTRLHSGENISRRLDFTVPEGHWDKTVKLCFVSPMGDIYITDPLEFTEGQGSYLLPSCILDGKGLLLCQLILAGEADFIEKSPVLEIPVFASVDDTSCPTISEQGLKSLAVIFSQLEGKADAVHSHNEAYYTKNETDALLSEKQNSLVPDPIPEMGSNNPVSSHGVYTAIVQVKKNLSELTVVSAMADAEIEAILNNS